MQRHRKNLHTQEENQFVIDDATETVRMSKRRLHKGTHASPEPHNMNNLLMGAFLMPTWFLQVYNLVSYPSNSDTYTTGHHNILFFYNHNRERSRLPIAMILCILLLIYAVDLSGHSRSLLIGTIWILGVGVSSLLFLYCYFYQNSILYHHTSFSWILFSTIIHTIIDTSVWISLACWTCLQFTKESKNSYPTSVEEDDLVHSSDVEEEEKNRYDLSSTGRTPQLLKRFLYFIVPFCCACTWTRSFIHWLLWIHLDPSHSSLDIQSRISVLTPREIWLICFIFSTSLYTVQCFFSSLESSSSWIYKWSYLLWISPVALYLFFYSLMIDKAGIYEDKWWLDSLENYSLERNISSHEFITIPSVVWDVLLLLCIPFFLQTFIPYKYRRIFQNSWGGMISSRPLTWAVFMLCTILAIEFRLLIPCTLYVTHAIHGKVLVQPLWLTILYLSTSLICAGFMAWFYGRMKHGEYLGGEYHDDIFQALLIASATSAAMACALPWRAFPFVLVATLSLSLFISTRMARFMILFILTTSSFAYAATFYRFYHIQRDIVLIPGVVSVTLHQFSLMIIFAGAAWGILVAMIGRESNRYDGENILPSYDVKGVLFSLTTCIVLLLEVPLSTINLGYLSRDIFQHEARAVYHPVQILTTSVMIASLAWYLSHMQIIHPLNFLLSTSFSLAKAVAATIMLVDQRPRRLGDVLQVHLCKQIAILFVALVVIRIPFVLIRSGSIQRLRGKFQWITALDRSLHDHKTRDKRHSPFTSWGFLHAYIFVLLPSMSLMLIHTLCSSIFISTIRITAYIGATCMVWAVATIFATYHLVNDCDHESLRKIPVLVFICGCMFVLLSPLGPSRSQGEYNFLSTDENGHYSIIQDDTDGTWGIIMVAILTAPLLATRDGNTQTRLSHRRKVSPTLFSLLLSFGLSSWFVTLQQTGDRSVLLKILAISASILVTFFGTFTIALAFLIESDNFQDVLLYYRLFLISLQIAFFTPPFLNILQPSSLLGNTWSSYYCAICLSFSLALSSVLKNRVDKSIYTRVMDNISVWVSWISVVIPISHSSFTVQYFLGIPLSIILMIISSLILLLLESKMSESHRRISSLHSHKQKPYPSTFLWLGTDVAHPLSIPAVASAAVLIIVSFYYLFLHGCPLSPWKKSSYIDLHNSVNDVDEVSSEAFHEILSKINGRINQHDSLLARAKLAASSFWTSEHLLVPTIHFLGLLSILFFWIVYAKYTITGFRQKPSMIILSVIFCVFPVFFCFGIPHLRVAAILGVLIGLWHSFHVNRIQWAERMQL